MRASRSTDLRWALGRCRLAALVLAIFLAPGCQPHDGRDQLVIFAAASLTDAFTAIADDFEAAHPDIDIKLSFAGSQSLRAQIEHGARPQLFASANTKHMAALRDRGLVAEPVIFARNTMVIVVPANNPAAIKTVADLPLAKRIVLAGETVPAGAYADRVLRNANATYGADFASRARAHIVSREPNVRQTLQKVVLGEADAAMVYATDARAAGARVQIIPIPRHQNVTAAYPIAVVTRAKHSSLGQQFIAYLVAGAGADTLAHFGFLPARE